MPEVTVSESELNRRDWRDVGAYAKRRNPDGTYTVSYSKEIEPSKLQPTRRPSRRPVESGEDAGPDAPGTSEAPSDDSL